MAPVERPSRRLPRGRHALDADAAAAEYRARLQAAAIEVVAEQGYGAASVTQLASAANVSTATFYDLFAGKQELVLAAVDAAIADAGSRLRTRAIAPGDLRDALAGVLSAVVDIVVDQPAAARTAIIELGALGPPGLQRRRSLTAGLRDRLRQAATVDGTLTISEAVLTVLAGGTMHVLDGHLRSGRLRPLRAAALDLATWGAMYETDDPRPLPVPDPLLVPAPVTPPPPVIEALPGGRHGLPSGFVRRHQRARILEAVLYVSAQQGFEATTVRELVTCAGLSLEAFYEHFATKEDAWAAAYDSAFSALFAAAWHAASRQPDRPAKVAAATIACLRLLEARPERARLLLVDAASAGRAGAPAVDETLQAFTRQLGRAAGGSALPRVLPAAMTGGLSALAAEWVLDGRAAELPALAAPMIEVILTPLLGLPAAARAADAAVQEPDAAATSDDRRRLMDAFAETVARDGLEATRLSDVAQQVGVELDVANTLFHDELDCATQALGWWAGRLVMIAAGAFLGAADDPPLAAHRALEAALWHIGRTPAYAALAVNDDPDIAVVALALRKRYIALFFQLIAGQIPAGEQQAPQPLSALEMVLNGIMAVLRRFAQDDRIAELPGELPALSLQCLTPFFGADEARRVAELTGSPLAN
ncbi:TetR/AcrR family transcriptional regulator [Baekduia sp.]|jgi:AcrR family transcriptional regulator|uniref:TetR/AcrR family transcriptional regulator n=1 Tax=Baekduia sp. TaxID=2600305 RepID=UPI002E00ED0B|nr:TetR/AcrR family transcriptional regulator [Baekduia sp.]